MIARRIFLFAKSGRAASLIEYGIVLPVFLLFLLGVMETGRLLWTYATLSRATETAARCGAVNENACGTATGIRSNAVSQSWGLSVSLSDFVVTDQACGVEVSTSYNFNFIVPGLNTITLNASSCYAK